MDRIWIVTTVVAGIFLFAIFIHQEWPKRLIAFGGLLLCGVTAGFSLRRTPVADAFGLSRPSRITLIYLLPAILLGTGLGILTRRSFDLTILPRTLSPLAFVAPLVGATEELIFRGYLQGYLRPIGRLFSIIYTSTIHTSYKLIVIITLSEPLHFDFFFLVFWTFIGGTLFGVLREMSRSSVPPMVAHALFDIFLYGGMAVFPVWVWS
jgi:membrane protease YdiL (CAAX protease family)